MTHRKNTISIYDYPEHLNPFREDADECADKSSATGHRRSSFRVNAWNVFSPNKGKSKAFEDTKPVSASATNRFMTWTPKLLRKASFLRSSPIRATVGPREIKTSVVSRSSFQSNATQCTLPPTSSRFSLQPSSRSSLTPNSSRSAPHSNSSLSTLPPNDILQTLASSRPTSPPGRPAPPNLRTSLSPGPIALAVTPSTENAPNNVNTGSSQTTPVPAVRKVFFPASTSENTVGEQPSKDETKYIKQGAKPKKKRRAPVPPLPSPGQSTCDIRQVNSNESDASVTSSVTASSAEDTLPKEEIATATVHLDAEARGPQFDAKNREQLNGQQIVNSENRKPKLPSENEAEHSDQLTNTQKDPEELENTHLNGHSEGVDEEGDRTHIVRECGNPIIVEMMSKEQVEPEESRGSKRSDGYLELQSAPENELLKENLNKPEDENLSCKQDWETHNAEGRNHLDDGVGDTKTDTTKNAYTLHNGKNFSSENIGLQNGEELKVRNIQQIETLTTPETKPQTVLPNMSNN